MREGTDPSKTSSTGLQLCWLFLWFLSSVLCRETQECSLWAFSCFSPGREGDSIISACLGGSQEIKSCWERAKQTARLPAPCHHADLPGAGGQEQCPLLIWMLLSLHFGCFLNEEGWETSLLFFCFQALEGLQWLCLPPKCSYKFLWLPGDAAASFRHSLKPGACRIWPCSATNCP